MTHALKGEGHDASEDGTGRGVPIVVSTFSNQALGEFNVSGVAATLRKSGAEGAPGCEALVVSNPTQDPISSTDGTTHALGCGSSGGQASVAVAVALRGRDGGATAEVGDNVAFALRASSGGGDKPHVLAAHAVRRLTPIECERLQGFPDGWTDIGPGTPDGPRYKALGNSMAVPVMRWIGRQIALTSGAGE